MVYSFRIRFNRSPTDCIQTDASELILPAPDTRHSLVLRARQKVTPIRESDQRVVVGSGYECAAEAETAGQEISNVLTVALARVRVGADFGHRAAKGVFTEYGLRWVQEQIGQRALNNVHGLMVYESSPDPKFVSADGMKLTRGTTPEAFAKAFGTALNISPSISERDSLAYTLFNASFFQATSDTRFLLLVMAVEALIDPARRSDEAVAHVDNLIAQTKSSLLPELEKSSMLGSLRWLRRESINQAGKRLAAGRLGSRRYSEMSAPEYFSYCYQLRSNLVHGNVPAPAFDDIGSVAATLEVFVSDLLTSPVLGWPDY